MSTISEKQLRARIQQAQAEHQNEREGEHQKRIFVERDNGIDFWRETAMSWHSKAKRLADQLQIAQNDVTGLNNEIKLRGIERDHWRAEYDQNYQDVLRAEARCDAFSDIMDALGRGWIMEPFDGCAKWWRHDTDTLAAIAKAAREWEIEKDSQPLPLFGGGAAEVDTTPQQVAALACDPNPKAWTRWEWGYAPNDLPADAIVEIVTFHGSTNTLEASVIDWEQVKSYRVIQRNPAVDAEHAADPDQSESVTENKADGCGGHMIGTDDDRIAFVKHAEKYGFEPLAGPVEKLTSRTLEDVYCRAFSYMNANGYPLKD